MSIDAWLQQRSTPQTEATLLGRRITGVVSWNMNDSCNYRCSYCTQRHMPDRTGTLEEIEQTLLAFSTLPGHWEFKLSGGEPFQQPGLDAIVSGLVAMGHCISVQTNFSANESRLLSFLEATRGALNLFSASLHLEYADARSFLDKYQIVQPFEKDGLRFHITTVGVPDRLVQIRDEIEPFFRKHNLVFKVQPEKVGGYLRDYSPEQKQILLELGGHNQTGRIAHNFQGKLCHSGTNYIVIKSTGEAFRCYPASRVGGQFARLGSLSEGITLLDGARICPYTYCNCTVPIQRGMIEGVSHDLQTTTKETDVH
ncbi:MAG: radical SAM protein [Pirellulaceae bacterium]|nr:radical SAM protein [Pirellulaceae bacterium]